MSETQITAIRLLCPDPAETAAFYRRVFRCDVRREDELVVLSFGRGRVELEHVAAGRSELAPGNATSFQHFAVVVSEMDTAYAELCAAPGWTAISRAGPERLPASSGAVTAFKCRDPDGHPLELLSFPSEVTPATWRNRDGLFLGIDHTAITVADTERSIAFYAELGFKVASRGVNRGLEQAGLDDIDAPVVEVTALDPTGGGPPHLELLCYRDPPPIIARLPMNDVLASRIILLDSQAKGTKSVDPDGHRLVVRPR